MNRVLKVPGTERLRPMPLIRLRFLLLMLLMQTVSFQSVAQFKVARWIGVTNNSDSTYAKCYLLKKDFRTNSSIRSAKLIIAVRGLYEATINNRRLTKAYLRPGWTSYSTRLQYQEYDVKDLLKFNNVLQVTLNGGWYSGIYGGEMQSGNYGKGAGLLCELEITYTDGTKKQLISDSTWRQSDSQIVYSNLYNGETIDHRIKSTNWAKVKVLDYSKNNLVPTISKPVIEQEIFSPKCIFTTPRGEMVIDFGQNLAGFVRMKVKGKTGDTISISHAEVLDSAGNFYTGNLRDAKATDSYILSGKGTEVFEPHFTYHGFRYIKVAGYRGKIQKGVFRAIAIYSALKHTGSFSCSSTMINRLQHNIEWSLNSNFVDIPTDCPQRSERLGWTGDAQVFCRTAVFNRNVKNFYVKWLKDLAADQSANGAVPVIIPDLNRMSEKGIPFNGVAGWGDAATIIPWTLYEIYGDKQVLRDQYASMKSWVDYIQNVSKNDLWTADGYGDWYAPGDSTSVPYIDQCFWAHSTQLLINTANVLNKPSDVETYTDLLGKIKKAFVSAYIDNSAKATTDTQTAYILALQFDMLPDSLQAKAAARLVALIKSNNNHLTTGFLGTPYLLPVLTKYGYTNVAYTLLNQRTCPSWLYPITKGATTIWEKWDAIKPNGTIQNCSFNHYAYGAVGQWLYETVAGIKPASPGYRTIRIAPQIGGGLRWVKASYLCSYGEIISNWRVQNNIIFMHIRIPNRTTAIVYLPKGKQKKLTPGTYDLRENLSIN